MRTVSEQITALETTRAAKAARMTAVMQKGMDEARSTDQAEQEEFDNLQTEVEAIDGDLTRLRSLERVTAVKAKPVNEARSEGEGSQARAGIIVKNTEKLEPGIRFARIAKAVGFAKGNLLQALAYAENRWKHDDVTIGVLKAAVPAGSVGGDSTDSPAGWGSALVSTESGPFADFVAYLRPMTILGKFGANGIPSLRRVPFRTPLVSQIGGGAGYWVGEGRAKPLTSFDFSRTTLEPLKVANIAIITMELLRDSSPNAEVLVRDGLAEALRDRLDRDFVDPNNAGTAGIKPPSIANGVTPIVSTGTDAAGVRTDVAAVMNAFIAANNPPTSGVWLMPSSIALQLSLMQNALGQPEFPGISLNGGTFFGLPVIASEYMPHESTGAVVELVNAGDIYLADEGGINVDMSTEASVEMSDAPVANSIPPTPATSMVSLWQTNSVGLRAERTINWKRRRTSGVQVLTDVDWVAS
jgi:hypothetical protein